MPCSYFDLFPNNQRYLSFSAIWSLEGVKIRMPKQMEILVLFSVFQSKDSWRDTCFFLEHFAEIVLRTIAYPV